MDAFGEGEIGILVTGAADVIRFAFLAEVSGARRVAADADEGRQVAERLALVNHDGTQSRVHHVGGLVESGLQLVLRAAVVAVGALDGANERGLVHLLGKLREDFGDLHPGHAGLDGLELTLHLAARLGIPGVEVAHAAAVPEEDHVFSASAAFRGLRDELADRHSEH